MLEKLYRGGLTRSQRQELVEEYKESQMRSVNIKAPKGVDFSKHDKLNMPRHKVLGYCSAFEECPLCYKCRSFNSSHEACRKCILNQEGSLCKREIHTPAVLSRMIRRERIDLDFGKFEVHCVRQEGVKVYIQKYKLPNGTVVFFDEESGMIDFEPMREYIGRSFHYFVNGECHGARILTKIEPVNGVNAIFMEKVNGDGEEE